MSNDLTDEMMGDPAKLFEPDARLDTIKWWELID